MCYSTDFLVCINIAPRNKYIVESVKFPWISLTPSMNFPWNLAHFKNSTVKSRIFSRELGWSLMIVTVTSFLTTKNEQ